MRVVTSEVRYRNPWISVREDVLEYDDGSPGLFGVIVKPDFAVVVPVEADGFWMVHQWRHPIQAASWEFPQGGWPPGGAPEAPDPRLLAQTELREETGITAASWQHLGRLAPNYGLVSHHMDVFLATDLSPGEPHRESSEEGMVSAFVSRQRFEELVRTGQCIDGATLAAYTLLLLAEKHR